MNSSSSTKYVTHISEREQKSRIAINYILNFKGTTAPVIDGRDDDKILLRILCSFSKGLGMTSKPLPQNCHQILVLMMT